MMMVVLMKMKIGMGSTNPGDGRDERHHVGDEVGRIAGSGASHHDWRGEVGSMVPPVSKSFRLFDVDLLLFWM
jgi:hypothetical protein